MSTIFLIRPRKISHLSGNYKCGYFNTLYLSEDLSTCEKELKKSLGVDSISSIDGVLLSDQELEKNELLFFESNNNIKYPFYYTLEFDNYLKKFFEDFQKNIATNLLSINISREHSDKICCLKNLLIKSYCESLNKYPKLKTKKIMNSGFFKNIFDNVDKMARYIKSCICSKDYKINNLELFINEIFVDLKNLKYPFIKEPVLKEYVGNNIVIEKKVKDDLFNTSFEIEVKSPEKFELLKIIQSFIPWENVEKVKTKGSDTVVISIPTFKDCFSIMNFNKNKFEYHYNRLELKDKKSFSFENNRLKIDKEKFEGVKYLFIENVHVFYKI